MLRRSLLTLFLAPVAVLLAPAAWGPCAPPAAADGAEGSLLERLSRECADLSEQGRRYSARLRAEHATYVGALVGSPARFVLALAQGTAVERLPRAGRVSAPGQAEAEATLLDADAELGLAVYELAGEPRGGAPLSSVAAATRHGALALLTDASPPLLLTLPEPGWRLDDMLLETAAEGGALWAPGGRLLGLGHAALADGVGAASCLACHDPGATSFVADATGRYALRAHVGEAQLRRLTIGALLHSQDGGATWGPAAARGPTRVVPAGVLQRVLDDVAATRRLRRPYLGVILEESPANDALLGTVFLQGQPWHVATGRRVGPDLVRAGHARVAQVLPESPAAAAELGPGDEITALDGRPLQGGAHFARLLARHRPGEVLVLTVKGREQPVRVALGDRDLATTTLASAAAVGLEVQTLSPELAAFLGLRAEVRDGAVVRAWKEGSPSQAAGLERGDVIVSANGGPVRDRAELDAVLAAARGPVRLEVERQGQRLTLTLTLPAAGSAPRAR